nr:probable serine/threonine-protein kinase DDB_G0282963 [Aedes albopictus]
MFAFVVPPVACVLTERSSTEPHKFELGYAARSPDDGQKFDGFDIVPNLNNNKPSRSTAILTTQNNHLHLGDNVNSSNGNASDLVVGALRHQRDLFSGSLGIPDVTTRVGSVIHAFETMARQRQALERNIGEKPYDSTVGPRYRSHRSNVKRVNENGGNRHKIILPSPKISPSSTESLTFVQQSFLPNTLNQFLNNSKHNNSSSSNNLHINNNNSGQYFLHSNIHNSNSNQALARTTFQSNTGSEIHYNLANDNESSNFDSLNLDDDYRKSSFGKQSKLQPTTTAASIGTLGRNQHLNDATTASTMNGGNANLRSSFQPAGDTENNSFSRNNPNVFFNSAPPLSQPPLSATASQVLPENDTPASPTAIVGAAAARTTVATASTASTTTTVTSPQTPASTMRYYNHDNNNNNSGNRRSTRSSAGVVIGGNPANDDTDGRGGAGFTSNDKFLRGTTVSQSFIKNVKNMRRKSSSYDLQTASAGLMTGGGTTANSSSGGGVGYRQKSGSALMTTAARHLYRRAPKGPAAASDNDTDELTTTPTSTGNIMAKPRESANVDSNRGSGKRKTFQPRTLDRAEI